MSRGGYLVCSGALDCHEFFVQPFVKRGCVHQCLGSDIDGEYAVGDIDDGEEYDFDSHDGD